MVTHNSGVLWRSMCPWWMVRLWQEDLTDHPPDFFVAVPLVFDVL